MFDGHRIRSIDDFRGEMSFTRANREITDLDRNIHAVVIGLMFTT